MSAPTSSGWLTSAAPLCPLPAPADDFAAQFSDPHCYEWADRPLVLPEPITVAQILAALPPESPCVP